MSLRIMQKFWESHTNLISDDPGLSFGGRTDNTFLACKWNHIVGDESVEHFFTAPSLEGQREIFDDWPADLLRKQAGYILYKTLSI